MTNDPTGEESFATKAIHAFQPDEREYNSLVPGIARSTIFKFKNTDEAVKIFEGSNNAKENRGKYIYARGNHPNQRQLEQIVTVLEGGTDAVAFASGMAAISAVALTLLSTGDEVVASNTLYGDSFKLFSKVVARWGVKTTFVDITDVEAIRKAMTDKTKLLYAEVPSNPTLAVADIKAIGAITEEHGVLFVVDNTLAGPYLQRPLTLGADIVVESMTKYLSGHSDAVGGMVIANDQSFIMDLWGTLFVTGGMIDPEAAWLILRSIKTLEIRMQRHNANAQAVAEHLSRHPKVKTVYYPGLPNHPQHELAQAQMNGFGALVAFEIQGGVEAGKKFVNSLRLFALSVSLGAVESLVNHPASMTHSVIPREQRLEAGISDELIRLSVGIEAVDDLIADIDQALKLA